MAVRCRWTIASASGDKCARISEGSKARRSTPPSSVSGTLLGVARKSPMFSSSARTHANSPSRHTRKGCSFVTEMVFPIAVVMHFSRSALPRYSHSTCARAIFKLRSREKTRRGWRGRMYTPPSRTTRSAASSFAA